MHQLWEEDEVTLSTLSDTVLDEVSSHSSQWFYCYIYVCK